MLQEFKKMPQHIAVIMDGNGRWAVKKNLPRSHGHAKGVEVLRQVLKYCEEFGIDYLTVYAFSTENWQRPREEVDALMELLAVYLEQEVDELKKQQVCLNVIGDIESLPEQVQEKLSAAVSNLAQYNFKRTLTLALSYGGRDEIIRASKKIIKDIIAGSLSPDSIDEEIFTKYLDTAGLPDPDLLIRTAGDLRLSNFLLWQLSYAELYATAVLWPDFSRADFIQALDNFERRDRKYGKITDN